MIEEEQELIIYVEKPGKNIVSQTEAIQICANLIHVNVNINYNFRRKLWTLVSAGQRICEKDFKDVSVKFAELALAINKSNNKENP